MVYLTSVLTYTVLGSNSSQKVESICVSLASVLMQERWAVLAPSIDILHPRVARIKKLNKNQNSKCMYCYGNYS